MWNGKIWPGILVFTCVATIAFAQDDLAARRAAVQELLVARGEDKLIAATIEVMGRSYVERYEKSHPEMTAERLKSFEKAIETNLDATKGEYLNHTIDIYVAHFSVEELKTAANFYKTDLGKKLVSINPSLLSEGEKYQMAWQSAAITKALNDLNSPAKAPQ